MNNSADLMVMVLQITNKLSVAQAVSGQYVAHYPDTSV